MESTAWGRKREIGCNSLHCCASQRPKRNFPQGAEGPPCRSGKRAKKVRCSHVRVRRTSAISRRTGGSGLARSQVRNRTTAAILVGDDWRLWREFPAMFDCLLTPSCLPPLFFFAAIDWTAPRKPDAALQPTRCIINLDSVGIGWSPPAVLTPALPESALRGEESPNSTEQCAG